MNPEAQRSMSTLTTNPEKLGLLEQLETTGYYPVGLPPRQTTVGELYAKSDDATQLMKALSKHVGGSPVLLIGDQESNIYRSLLHQAQKFSPQSETSQAKLREEARRRARLIAKKDQAFYQGLQDFLESSGETHRRVPVGVMSELLDPTAFTELCAQVQTCILEDPKLAAQCFEAIPKRHLKKTSRKKSYTELTDGQREDVILMMDYVFQQIAHGLCFQSTKWGHANESAYDELTRQVASHLGLSCPQFERLPLQDAEGISPYRTVLQKTQKAASKVLSGDQNIAGLASPDFEAIYEGAHLGELSLFEAVQAADRETQNYHAEADRLMLDFRRTQAIYHASFRHAETEDVRQLLKAQYAKELFMMLGRSPFSPKYSDLVQKSGLAQWIDKGMTLEEATQDSELPFECYRKEGESDADYGLRYLASLLCSIGLHVPGLGRKGFHYIACEEICDLAQESQRQAVA